MIIETKHDIGDHCCFLMCNKIHWALIKEIEYTGSVVYTINKNDAGSQYTKRFLEKELFKTKKDLLESL